VDAISDTADRAAKLTGQLLAFARRQALKPEVFDAGDRVRTIADMLRTVVGSRVHLDLDAPTEPCLIEADASQFETALVNLVVNARDAMDGSGRLKIRARSVVDVPSLRGQRSLHGRFVSVRVTDTGHGIPGDKIHQIFEPFFTTKDVGKGTGLGLSQVYGFAKQSGGDVAVESQVGVGTNFTIYLPQADAIERAASNANVSRAERIDGGGHVLVVEDNEMVGAFATQLLNELGYETSWAASAEAALKLLGDQPDLYDALFSDVVMPGMNGVDLAREIRRTHPGMPILLTSGYSDVLAQEQRHGFSLLQKPYSVEELGTLLRKILRG
jgi:CheY-like chemotaxis protein